MRHSLSLSFLALTLCALSSLAPGRALACGPYDPIAYAHEQGASTAAFAFLAAQHAEVTHHLGVVLEDDGTARVQARGPAGVYTLTLTQTGEAWRVTHWTIERAVPPLRDASAADAPR